MKLSLNLSRMDKDALESWELWCKSLDITKMYWIQAKSGAVILKHFKCSEFQ